MKIIKSIKRLITNIKVAQKILEGTFLICPYCKSLEVEQEYPYIENHDKGTMKTKTYDVICKKCKSQGMINESWIK